MIELLGINLLKLRWLSTRKTILHFRKGLGSQQNTFRQAKIECNKQYFNENISTITAIQISVTITKAICVITAREPIKIEDAWVCVSYNYNR